MGLSRSKLAFTLLVLFGINTMNFFDRQVLAAVQEPLKKEWSLTDRQLGELGTAFTLLYAAVGLPLGRWADIGNRTYILASGAALWSVLTAASGRAWNFASMFALRLGVGVGEASCAPAANSLLGDLFPPGLRARAVSIFMLGLPLGLGLSFLISGRLAQEFGWRTALYIAGGPGIVLAFLALFIEEPRRTHPQKDNNGEDAEATLLGERATEGSESRFDPVVTTPTTWWTIVRRAIDNFVNCAVLVLQSPTMWWIIASGAIHNFNMYAQGQFLSSFMMRYHGLNVAEAGKINGIVYGLGGLGILFGGWACDLLAKRRISGRLEVATLALMVYVPSWLIALQQPAGSAWGFAAWVLPGIMLSYIYYAGVYATIQDIIEPGLRGSAMALYFFAMYLLGAALGPIVTGWVSDALARRAMLAEGSSVLTDSARATGLYHAMYLLPSLGTMLVLVLFAASRTVGKDYARLQERLASARPKS
jgi:MFS family permease